MVRTIIDSGPLVALLKRDESLHPWAREAFRQLPAEGMVTCEAVVSEACFLLRASPAAIDALFRRLNDGVLRLVPLQAETAAVHGIMRKYRNLPASFADACLVRLSELHPSAVVVSTDSDFHVYRRGGKQVISLLSPRR